MFLDSIRKKLSSFQIIILGFLGVILLGTILLMLPVSMDSGSGASLSDAIFTATSAVCVTGLVIRDTATYWSVFGQVVILTLIQVGGLGIITFAAFIAMISGRKISLLQRSMLQDSISAHQIGGIVKMTGFIFKTALIIELTGAVLMLPAFCSRYGSYGIWMAFFHSVSAFCNAGFDIMGDKTGAFSSLTGLSTDPWVVIPVSLLIITGGIGFLTWKDLTENRFRFRSYRMQSKVVLATTLILLVVSTLLLFFLEYDSGPVRERLFLSLFQAVTPRTAGFNTADLTALSGTGKMLLIALMLIGGSPGSTAGGMKTTTLAVLLSDASTVFRRKNHVQMFGRRVEEGAIRNAATLFIMYLTLPMLAAAIISLNEGLPVSASLFETASAIGTVGLSMGITPSLGLLSRLILILLMFFGRVGGLTLIYAALNRNSSEVSQRPVEKIMVG